MDTVKKPSSVFKIIITGVILLVSIVILYFVYGFLFGSSLSSGTQIITAQTPANVAQTNLPKVTGLYEGGDYTVSLWMYINSYNINRNKRKHILEISGANFSTLLIALGAFKNTLMVRTHSRDNDTVVIGNSQGSSSLTLTGPTGSTSSSNWYNTRSTGSTGPTGPRIYGSGQMIDQEALRAQYKRLMENFESYTPDFTNPMDEPVAMEGFVNTTLEFDNPMEGSVNAAVDFENTTEGFVNATPGSIDASRQDGSLTPADLTSLFTSLAMDDSLINPTQICDIPSIDMQRWVNITVVLSGRTIDVYIDGKLTRSCVTRSYYKVDPTGVSLKIADRGGFDGYINTVTTFNNPISPADIYNIYQAGPSGKSAEIGSLMSSLFTGK